MNINLVDICFTVNSWKWSDFGDICLWSWP